jgi:hypothetical protein
MRKSFIAQAAKVQPRPLPEQEWLDIEHAAKVEVTSEDPNFPIESALISGREEGWRAAARGEQIIRIVFDKKRDLRCIRLEFSEAENERTQEFTLRWSAEPDGPFSQIVRQQWTFSPRGSTAEVEDYQVSLRGVSVLELALKPDLTPSNAFGSLARWRVA